MADFDDYISGKSAATTPLGATDYLLVLQGGAVKKVGGDSVGGSSTDANLVAEIQVVASDPQNSGKVTQVLTGTSTILTFSGLDFASAGYYKLMFDNLVVTGGTVNPIMYFDGAKVLNPITTTFYTQPSAIAISTVTTGVNSGRLYEVNNFTGLNMSGETLITYAPDIDRVLWQTAACCAGWAGITYSIMGYTGGTGGAYTSAPTSFGIFHNNAGYYWATGTILRLYRGK